MERFVKGDVVVLPFTSEARRDKYSILLENEDFRQGSLNAMSTIKSNRLFTTERSYKGFYRSILPTRVIPQQAKASYRDGVLEVVMPKAKKKKFEKAKKLKVE